MSNGSAFRKRLHAGEICIGSWISFTDPTATEVMCGSGFDFLIIDAEHGPHDLETVMMHAMATKGTGTLPIVRVAWNDMVRIKQVLDVGALGVLVPMVRNRQDVELAVSACMYPPMGVRGFGPRRPSNYERDFSEYIDTANDQIVVFVQIEHVDAVDNIDEILGVDRLDGVFIGSNDLSGSMGLLGQPQHPRVLEAIDTVISAAHRAGVPMGMAGPGRPRAAYEWISRGVQFITVGSDTSFLLTTADEAVAELRGLLGGD